MRQSAHLPPNTQRPRGRCWHLRGHGHGQRHTSPITPLPTGQHPCRHLTPPWPFGPVPLLRYQWSMLTSAVPFPDRIVGSAKKMVRVLSSDVLCASYALSCLSLHTRLTLLAAAALLALSLFSQLGSLVRPPHVAAANSLRCSCSRGGFHWYG